MGLSIKESGKYTSKRHHLAEKSGKLTAGQAGKMISKIIGRKVLASDVIAAYKHFYKRIPEWHHSGFFNNGKRMGRTYFLSEDEIQFLAGKWKVTFDCISPKEKLEQTQIKGFFWKWEENKTDRKLYYKVLGVYAGSAAKRPKNFTGCCEELYQIAKSLVGKKYFGWDKPTVKEFKERKSRTLIRNS